MATSFLFKACDQTSTHDEQNMKMKPLCGSCEENKSEPGKSSRGRKANGKGPKKQPQRGLGVAQLERLRIQESLKKMNETCGVPTFADHQNHHHLLQCHHPNPMLPFTVHDPFGSSSSSSVPVRYGAAASNHVHGVFQCPQQVINGNTNAVLGQGPFIGNRSGLNVAAGGGGGGSLVPNNQLNRVGSYGSGASLWSPLVGSPLETSKELSSMPNVHYQPQCFDVCLKKSRFNEVNVKGSNARSDMPLEIWPNGPDFLGLNPQPAAPNLVGETSDFYSKLARHDAAAAYTTPNPDEGVEVVAVHRRGNTVNGRVFMEYEFFPGNYGRGTTSEELELHTTGSVAVGGEASPITATAYGDTASNSIDLSLKLSH